MDRRSYGWCRLPSFQMNTTTQNATNLTPWIVGLTGGDELAVAALHVLPAMKPTQTKDVPAPVQTPKRNVLLEPSRPLWSDGVKQLQLRSNNNHDDPGNRR